MCQMWSLGGYAMNQAGADAPDLECAPDVDGKFRLELDVAKPPDPDFGIRR